MFQQIVAVGNLGRDVELRYLASGSPVADFSLAVNRRWKDKDGNQQEHTDWFKVVCWDKLGETVNKHLSKGRQVLVIGRVTAEAWIDKDGNARAEAVITASDVRFLGGRNDADIAPAEGGGADLQDIPF